MSLKTYLVVYSIIINNNILIKNDVDISYLLQNNLFILIIIIEHHTSSNSHFCSIEHQQEYLGSNLWWSILQQSCTPWWWCRFQNQGSFHEEPGKLQERHQCRCWRTSNIGYRLRQGKIQGWSNQRHWRISWCLCRSQ
jgi:hypothetical protein